MQLPRHIARLPFLGWGLGLCALKAGIDALVFRSFGEIWSPLIYFHPTRAPLFRPEGRWDLWFTLWAVAAPFLVAGVWLTLARLKDANLPPAFSAFFFVPFANLLFFALAAAVPSRPSLMADELPFAGRVSRATAFLVASAAGAILFLGCMAISLGLLRAYGIALFAGAPFLAGLTVAKVLAELAPVGSWGRSILAALAAAWLSMVVLIAFALEGAVCILMASPLVLLLALLGSVLGHAAFLWKQASVFAPGLALFPLLALLDGQASEPLERVVVSEIIVAAPPEAIWPRVVSFPELAPPREWVFRAGVATPLRASIQGQGVGAVRSCEFSTGAFVEPITVWKPNQELTFSVASQPDILRELTLYPGPRPPHLDDYLSCTQGQFQLLPLPDGRTRLVGRTWYRLRMGPEAYWSLWSDFFIHRIHIRVLRHVAALAETPPG